MKKLFIVGLLALFLPSIASAQASFYPDTGGPHYIISQTDGCAQWSGSILTSTGSGCGSSSSGFSTTSTNYWLTTKTTDDLTEGSTNQYFTNARARSALSATFPIVFNSSTGAFTFSGVSTSSAPTVGNLAYWTAANKLGSAATTTASCSGSVSCSSFTVIGSSPVTISATASSGNVATSSAETANQIPYWTTTSGTPAKLSGGSSAFTYDPSSATLTLGGASLTINGTQPDNTQTLLVNPTENISTAGFSSNAFTPTLTLNMSSGNHNYFKIAPTFLPAMDTSDNLYTILDNPTVGNSSATTTNITGTVYGQYTNLVTGSGYGGTITQYTGAAFPDITDGGGGDTVTKQAGVAIQMLDGATNNTELILGGLTPVLGNHQLYMTGTQPTNGQAIVQAPTLSVSGVSNYMANNIQPTIDINQASGAVQGFRLFPVFLPSQDFSSNIINLNNNFQIGNGTATTSNLTSNVIGQNIQMFTGSGYTGTISNEDGIVIADANIGNASASITKQTGLLIQSLSNATNNSSIVMGQSTAPTGNFGIYDASTYDNYFNGDTGFGTTSPWKALSISGDLALTGGLFDSTASEGTDGMVLQSTGSATKWVATSSLGITGGSGAWPFTTGLTNFGTSTQATTTPEWFKTGLYASSTSEFENASTTLLSVSDTSYLKTVKASGDYDGTNAIGTSWQSATGSGGSNGAFLQITAGDGGSSSGSGGTITFKGGSAGGGNANGGDIKFAPGNLAGSGARGRLFFYPDRNSTSPLEFNLDALSSTRILTFSDFAGTPALGSYSTGFAGGYIPFGSSGLLATSSALSFDGTRLNMTYASTTALSATTLCLTGDTCRTTWPTGGSGTVTSVGLSDANSTLTIGGSPVTTSGTLTATLNLAHANTWTGLQSFANATSTLFGFTTAWGTKLTLTNASTTNLSASQSLYVGSNKVSGERYPSWGYATSTTWTATSTVHLLAPFSGTLNDISCFTDAGTLNVTVYDGSTAMTPMFNASTTKGTVTFSASNTFSRGDDLKIDFGTPASSPTSVNCTGRATGN